MTDHRHERPTPDDVLADALRDAAPDRFAVGFTGRVTERLARERANVSNGAALDFTTALERHFVRIVPLLAAASLILAIYGWWGGSEHRRLSARRDAAPPASEHRHGVHAGSALRRRRRGQLR